MERNASRAEVKIECRLRREIFFKELRRDGGGLLSQPTISHEIIIQVSCCERLLASSVVESTIWLIPGLLSRLFVQLQSTSSRHPVQLREVHRPDWHTDRRDGFLSKDFFFSRLPTSPHCNSLHLSSSLFSYCYWIIAQLLSSLASRYLFLLPLPVCPRHPEFRSAGQKEKKRRQLGHWVPTPPTHHE